MDLPQPSVRRVVVCVWCKGENVRGNWNPDGQWHGYCVTCGTRFWHTHN